MDNDKLTEMNEPQLSHEDKAPVTLDFKGEATIARPLFRRGIDQELIQELNSDASKISEAIKVELKSALPSVDITVNLEFSPGSVEFAGVIAIADWMSRISGSISFIEFAIRAARFSINKIIRRRIEERAPVKSISTKVTWRKEEPFHPVTRFLWWCAGTVTHLIRESKTDKTKYEGIGGAILTTGVLAVFSGFYAIYTMFQGTNYGVVVAVILGLIWGLVIFNLDRYIVCSMKKEDEQQGSRLNRFFKELPPAIPRLLLAIIIGVTLSKPLELRLFQKPINEQVVMIHDKQVRERQLSLQSIDAKQRGDIQNELGQIDAAIGERAESVSQLLNEFHKETDSTGGSRRYGYSTIAKIKENSYLQAKKNAQQFEDSQSKRKRELQQKLEAFDLSEKNQLDEFRRGLGNDFLTKMRALSELANQSDAVRWANWFVIFLLILIEVTPVIVKLMSPSGPYDVKLNLTNNAESKEAGFRHDSVIRIAEHHYDRITEGERQADDMLFQLREAYGDRKIRESFNKWSREFNLSGQGPTFDDLLTFVKTNIFSHRKP